MNISDDTIIMEWTWSSPRVQTHQFFWHSHSSCVRACVFHKIVTVCLISLNCLITYNPFFYFVEYMQKNKHWKSFFTLFFWHHFLKEVHIFFILWLIFVVTYGRLGFFNGKIQFKISVSRIKIFQSILHPIENINHIGSTIRNNLMQYTNIFLDRKSIVKVGSGTGSKKVLL